MERIYLLVGDSDYLVNGKIKYYQKESNIDEFNIITYDAEELELSDLVQELFTVSFFSQSKMVIVNHAEHLNKYAKEDLKDLIKYIENPSEDIVLVFAAKAMDETHAIYDALSKHAYIDQIKSFDSTQLPKYIEEQFLMDGYTIDKDAILELAIRTQNELYHLHQEIEKLKLFTIEEKRISRLEIEQLVSRSLEDNIFTFSTAFLKGDTRQYVAIYDDLMSSKMPPSTIFNHLFQTVNLIYQAYFFMKQGKSQEQIAQSLGISTGRAYYVIKEAKEQNMKRIEKTIKDLAKLDVLIKSGRQDEKLGFELLLLGNLK
ncbi:DNA polymerase III subunit delta [Acholeplasma hippikon]|nr:DNA polymerase III subunit delta [Acholeplasma hippikon]